MKKKVKSLFIVIAFLAMLLTCGVILNLTDPHFQFLPKQNVLDKITVKDDAKKTEAKLTVFITTDQKMLKIIF